MDEISHDSEQSSVDHRICLCKMEFDAVLYKKKLLWALHVNL